MENISFDIKIYDNVIEIIPDEPVEDNCIYEISFKDIYSKTRDKKIDNETFKICTQLSPVYTTIDAVNSLVGSYDIPDEIILYNIREASKFADYIKLNSAKYDFQKDKIKIELKQTTPFEVTQYVKYKAAYNCLLKEYINKSNTLGVKGTLGPVSFENSDSIKGMKELLDELKSLVSQWEAHLRGYGFEGRTSPQAAVRAIKASPPNTTSRNTYSRGVFNEF